MALVTRANESQGGLLVASEGRDELAERIPLAELRRLKICRNQLR